MNPSKTQMGKISKVILQDICVTLRIVLNNNQWHSTEDCIKWFKDYDKNVKCSFIKYDIKDFYPSITEKTVDVALNLTKEHMSIPEDKINIIKHCHKSLLFHNDEEKVATLTHQWVLLMEQKSELIGCLLLHSLNNIIDPSNHSFYQDDGLIIVDNCTPRKGNVIRKKLHWLFDKFGFKFNIQTNLKITKFLDIALNLYNNTISLFWKKQSAPT